jgi:hypothetical protein
MAKAVKSFTYTKKNKGKGKAKKKLNKHQSVKKYNRQGR